MLGYVAAHSENLAMAVIVSKVILYQLNLYHKDANIQDAEEFEIEGWQCEILWAMKAILSANGINFTNTMKNLTSYRGNFYSYFMVILQPLQSN